MPKYSFARALKRTYCEVSQPNPLRWEILHREGNRFTPQTAKFKCKDFLNDLVAKLAVNRHISIYGMDMAGVKVNDEGVYIRLSNIIDKNQFMQNLESVVNFTMLKELHEAVGVEPLPVKGKVLLLIPKCVFANTYLISAVSWLIRLCNTTENLQNFDYAVNQSVAANVDNAIAWEGKKLLTKWKFTVPDKYKGYWYYAGKTYNSEHNPDIGAGTIHNNGVMSWACSV